FLKNPEKYERMGARVPKGTLLFGPPGTGKTLLARAVAGEADVPFFSINGSEFIQMFVGVGASRVRDIFNTAKENAPSILFIDEIDAVGRQRGAGVGGGQDEREQTLNQILSEMDGFTQADSVMVLASTNRPDVLDPALMRPGRFDRHITVGRPSKKGRVEIFNVYLKKIPVAPDVDVEALAKKTVGFTGADIRNLVNEATLWATRNDKEEVNAADFDFAFEKIELGLKRDEIITPKEKRKTAYHEAGHALVGWFNPVGSSVHKITIVPRGRALGATWFLPEDDKANYNESEIRATLARFLAGRAAEKLVYNETSAGAENDLQRGTELARNMIVRWGMNDRVGPVGFPDSETHPFLGREMTTGERAYSEETARIIDEEIVKTMREADETARNLIIEKRDLFEKLTDALVAEEELDYAQIEAILGPSPKSDDGEEEESAAEPEPGNPSEPAESAEPEAPAADAA
ncbi:MAG: ATP-dependent zinc metalloprotease FtsH, partial [Thermoguttaceae bacterium]|nr:ATP-dependent zinc metalloprotease FtsH [Thermoguttaceae bacterium]